MDQNARTTVEPAAMSQADGMRILWDVPVPMDDGVVLRADIFLPQAQGRYGAVLTYGPYAKGLSFQSGYKSNWDRMTAAYPEITEGSTNKYQSWELVDPEKWVPDGFACVRFDSRGAGTSQTWPRSSAPRATSATMTPCSRGRRSWASSSRRTRPTRGRSCGNGGTATTGPVHNS